MTLTDEQRVVELAALVICLASPDRTKHLNDWPVSVSGKRTDYCGHCWGVAEDLAKAHLLVAKVPDPGYTIPPKPKYAMMRRDGSMREFPSKRAAVIYNRELPPLALSYRKGVYVSHDDGKTWEWSS